MSVFGAARLPEAGPAEHGHARQRLSVGVVARFVAVDLVSAHVHRALAYVRLLNDNGVDPPRARVEDFARREGP